MGDRDRDRARGRGRGRSRGGEYRSGNGGGGGGGGGPPPGYRRGGPQHSDSAPGASAWGAPSASHSRPVQQPSSSQQQQPAAFKGRATFRKGAAEGPGGEAEFAAQFGGEGAGDASQTIRRGTVRGKRPLHENIFRTKPETVSSKQGSHGSVVRLQANYFKLLQQPNWCLYQYRVDFAPEDDRTNVKKALFRRAMKDILTGYIFDGTVMFCPNRIDPSPREVFVQDEQTNANIRITVRLVGDVAMGDYSYLQLFNIIMRKCLGHLKLQLVGRNFFDALAKVTVEEHRMELWPGYVTSIRQHENAILMCVEITHKVMRHDTVLRLLNDCMQEDSRDFKRSFQARIVGCVVLTEYNNRTYHIDDVDFDSTPESTFTKKDGTKISYATYFRDRYNLRIANMRQPMLVSRAKAREIRAGMAETIYLVPELCRMTGLTDAQRANFHLMRALAEHTRVGPGPRINKLMAFSRRLREKPEIVQELKQWDLKLAETLVEFPGRLLPPETISGGRGSTYSAGREADWTRELRSRPMLQAAPINIWAIVCPSRCKSQAQSFMQTLQRAASGMQWSIPFPKLQEIRDDRPASYLEGLDHAINLYHPQLILCVVTNNKSDRYNAIKKKCCVDRPVPTQVILAKNLDSKGVMSIATKVAIQLNCKLGGAPWSIPLPYKNMMVVGYDVCHDANHKERSYGAMVATLNGECSRYFSSVTAHSSGEELSNDFALNLLKACKKYHQTSKVLPDKILIFRDGVGDGQLRYVFEHEVENIKAKLAELYGGAENVKIAFVVVSKRINTRIFCGNQNPQPGTIVDDIITLPERYDFFIISQCVRQGTVSPTSYNVLYDSIGLGADKLQRLSYKLTHMYYNWSGTVRVPAPCQYAHKLAYLVAQSLHRNPHPELETLLYFL